MADKKDQPLGPQPPANSEPYQPYGKGKRMADKPQVAPDGHENLTQADIDARDS